MSVQAVTLNLPDTVYQRAKQAADALNRPLEDVIVNSLLDQQGRGELDESGRRELKALLAECGRHVLRRAEAVALLIARGHSAPQLLPIPTDHRLKPAQPNLSNK